jgi:hypothetical protein
VEEETRQGWRMGARWLTRSIGVGGWVGATHTLALHSGGYPPTASLTDSDQMKHHAAGDRPFLHGFGSRSRLRMF